MELFILLGSGLLGAAFLASQSNTRAISFVWIIVFGAGGGAIAYGALRALSRIPMTNNMESLLLLFVIGGFSGALTMLIFIMIRARMTKP